MSAELAPSLVTAGASLVGVVVGFAGTLVTTHIGRRNAETDRARALLAQVVKAVTTFELEVDTFSERRTSRRARLMAVGQVVVGLSAGFSEGKGRWRRAAADEILRLRTWDMAEGERLFARVQPVLGELYPALLLLSLMDPQIQGAANKLGQEVDAYSAAKDDDARKTATTRIATALGGLSAAVNAYLGRNWWYRHPASSVPKRRHRFTRRTRAEGSLTKR